MLKDVPIYYELWRQFNGFPADYIEEEKLNAELINKNNAKN
jgi:hypothetical protein